MVEFFTKMAMDLAFQNGVEIQVDWEKKGVVSGSVQGNNISFNREIMYLNQEVFEQTVYHEVAHVVVQKEYGHSGRGHGWKWKEVMIRLGKEPRRCHNYAVPFHTKVFCSCLGREHFISKRRVNNIKRGERYRCNFCKQVITFNSPEPLKLMK